MSKRFVTAYSIFAFLVLLSSIALFSVSVHSALQKGADEAELSFSWITRSSSLSAVTDGFMSDRFVAKLTETCRRSQNLVALMITAPSGVVYAWPDRSAQISYDSGGNAQLNGSSIFMQTFSTELDIPGSSAPTVIVTAVMYILHPSAIFDASRLSFMITLALILVTLIMIIAWSPVRQSGIDNTAAYGSGIGESDDPYNFNEPVPPFHDSEGDYSITDEIPFPDEPEDYSDISGYDYQDDIPFDDPVLPDFDMDDTVTETVSHEEESIDEDPPPQIVTEDTEESRPEGLFSPATGVGWEAYLKERLDAELIRSASSEQDLSLMIIRVSGTKHTDLVSRKIAQAVLELIQYRDMVFEFGSDGFAGVFQNVSLDQAMKLADGLYETIDTLLSESEYESQITIGITTRTARLITAERMIEEAVTAAAKAIAEPDLPIVAFRANPDKYRDYVAGNL